MHTSSNIDELSKRLLPLTVLRRKAGEVFAKLPEVGSYLVTKDGKPIAELSAISRFKEKETVKERLERLKPLIGGFKLGMGMTPKQMNKLLDKRYEEMLPR